jgi:hypothetical protein
MPSAMPRVGYLFYTPRFPSQRWLAVSLMNSPKMALDYAKEHQLKVDVVCPVVFHYLTKHPESKPLVGVRGYR